MKKLITICIVLVFASAPTPAAVTIDFGQDFGAPATSVELTNQLQSYGVVFSSANPDGVIWHGTDPDISTYPYCINAGWDGGMGRTVPIRVDFDPFVSEASIRGYDGGGDYDILILQAYDSSGSLVDDDVVSGDDFKYPGNIASVSAPEIAYITFHVDGTSSGLFFDDLSYVQSGTNTLSGWVFMLSDMPDIGYSLDEEDLLCFFSFDFVQSFNLATGGQSIHMPTGWIYVDWPFYFESDTAASWFALPPAGGLWVYHFSTVEWEQLPQIIP